MTRSFKRLLKDCPEINTWYKGWMLFCPIYFAYLENDNAAVEPRHEILVPLFWAAEAFESFLIMFLSTFDSDYEPSFMFRVNEKPYWKKHERL